MDVVDNEARHWKLVMASMLGIAAVALPSYAMTLFMGPLTQEFGWSRAEVAASISITSGMSTAFGPIVGRLVDRFGSRWLAIGGTAAGALAVAANALVADYTQFLVVWFAVGLAVAFSSPMVWTVSVAGRFVRNRGLALSIAFCGTNLIGMIAPIVSAILIDRFGWRAAWPGLGAIIFLMCVPTGLLYLHDSLPGKAAEGRNKPVRGPGLTLRQAVRVREFWVLAGALLLAGTATLGIIQHLVPAFIDTGMSRIAAAGVLSVLSFSAICGRIIAGWFFDRVFAPYLTTAILMMPTIACTILALTTPTGLIPYVLAVPLGLAVGAEINLASYLASRYFGFAAFASIYSILFAVMALGYAIGPVLVGRLYDLNGNYHLAMGVIAALFFTAGMLMLACRRYPVFAPD